MATKTAEISVEDKLKALYSVQLIDTQIDKLRAVRGELPMEVKDLEDEIVAWKLVRETLAIALRIWITVLLISDFVSKNHKNCSKNTKSNK